MDEKHKWCFLKKTILEVLVKKREISIMTKKLTLLQIRDFMGSICTLFASNFEKVKRLFFKNRNLQNWVKRDRNTQSNKNWINI